MNEKPGHKIVRISLGILLGAVCLWGMTLLSEFRQGDPPQISQLRLAWRVAGQRAKVCRTLTAVELAKLPLHMRHKEECQERNFDYALRLSVDGREVLSRTISPSGVRGDRPVYVQEDVPLLPGVYKIKVEFSALEPSFLSSLDESQKAIVLDGMKRSVRFDFDQSVTTEAGRIVLLSSDEHTGKLTQSDSKI